MKKTIKELADEIGVSKTAINKKVTANQKRKHFSKNGNRFLIDEEGQKLIKEMFSDGIENQPESKNENRSQTSVGEVSELVSVLKDRVSSAEKQLDEKDKQISSMQKLLDQQQVLTLQANKKIAELETTLNVEEENVRAKESSDDIKKEGKEPETKSFFARLFGR